MPLNKKKNKKKTATQLNQNPWTTLSESKQPHAVDAHGSLLCSLRWSTMYGQILFVYWAGSAVRVCVRIRIWESGPLDSAAFCCWLVRLVRLVGWLPIACDRFVVYQYITSMKRNTHRNHIVCQLNLNVFLYRFYYIVSCSCRKIHVYIYICLMIWRWEVLKEIWPD